MSQSMQVGADPASADGRGPINEDEAGIPDNRMPHITRMATCAFRGSYETPDGTGVRDYINVVDLARGHLAAFDALAFVGHNASLVVNLGTGQRSSVLDVVRAFEHASGRPVVYEIATRRPGDIAWCYADPVAAEKLREWRAEFGVEERCVDHWRW